MGKTRDEVYAHDSTHSIPEDLKLRGELAKDWHGKFICGFSSKIQLKRWFSEKNMQDLHQLGY